MAPDDIKSPLATSLLPPEVQALRALSDDEIEKQSEQADQKLAALRGTLSAAAKASVEAGTAFRRAPDSATAIGQLVADQALVNARDAVQAFEAETSVLLTERARRRALARMREIAPSVDGERVLVEASKRWRVLLMAIRDQLTAETQQMVSELAAVREAAAEYSKAQGELTLADWRLSGGEARGEYPMLREMPLTVSLDGAMQRLQRDHGDLLSARNAHAMSLGIDQQGVALTVRARVA